jgi:tetratricopeptide (TPR) repeat protein
MSEGASSGNNGKTRRFAAFISYAHADAGVAANLQSRLERYRLPKHIAESHAEGRAALGQIFRDREDLAAAPSLSDAIRKAIAETEALVVICSPDAQASRWVGEEIALFQKLHPDRPILAALVRGEPNAAFPAALTAGGAEPLAADLRKGRDGESLGFLKIVAGIADIPLDTLIQRDAQRRIRRVMWITGGALAAMLVMGIMTTLAIQARNEAARQRASAEGLVEYMLTDLREKLRGVGRLDVMEGVNKRAMKHYRGQGDLDSMPADSLERRARVLHAMGEDDQKRGKLNSALQKFQEAHRATETLWRRSPANAARIFAHAQSEFWIGYTHYLNQNFERARKYLLSYQKLAELLSKLPGEAARGTREVAYAKSNLCALSFKRGDNGKMIADTCAESVAAQRELAKLEPKSVDAQISLANSLAWQADALSKTGELRSALLLRAQQTNILDNIVANDPKNLDMIEFRMTALVAVARLKAQIGDQGSAAELLKHQLQVAKNLRNHDPENAIWTRREVEIEQHIDALMEQ